MGDFSEFVDFWKIFHKKSRGLDVIQRYIFLVEGT